ncbi:unnamed protein product [Parnassius apollo]|uniref:(apollo) hypothetical protein n=1 Tax=Parnassius apollo TaxID=110799 RepID=A0A8S3W1N4_PARAO|nr:unnamed protein product [Parnassius apollo]
MIFSTATIGRWSRGIKLDAAANGGRWSLAAKCVGAIAMANKVQNSLAAVARTRRPWSPVRGAKKQRIFIFHT